MNGQSKTGLERIIALLFVLVGVLIVTLAALAFFYYGATPAADNVFIDVLGQRIEFAQGLTVDGVDVSNKTIEEARPLVKAAQPKPLGTISIQANGQSAELDLSSLQPKRDYEATLQKAILLGNDGDRDQKNADLERIAANGEHLESPLTYDASSLKEQVDKLAQELSVEARDAEVRILKPDERFSRGFSVDPAAIVSSEPGTVQESIQALFEYVEEVPGSLVDAGALLKTIQERIDKGELDTPIEAVTTPVEPTVKLAAIKYDLVEISRASSSFAKSPYNNSNRMFNINKAATIINGYVLLPNEQFSCNGVLGPRSTSKGWKEAGAIKDGQSVQETGGGICQVSSTVFNAVLKANLEIVERSPHSWPLSYITAGQDATISTGGPDFIFKNNREQPVILVAYADLDNKTITVLFYGVPLPNQDYDEIKLVSNQTSSTKQPSTQYSTVKSMRPGSQNVIRQGRSGSSHETYKEYYKDGVMIRREFSHNTKYRALASIIERGPTVSRSSGNGASAAVDKPVTQAPAPQPAPAPVNNDVIFDIPEE